MLSPKAGIFEHFHITHHLALAGQAQGFRAVFMRGKAQPAFFPEIRRRYITLHLYCAGAAGAHATAVNPARFSIVWGDVVAQQNAAEGIAGTAVQVAGAGRGFQGDGGHKERFGFVSLYRKIRRLMKVNTAFIVKLLLSCTILFLINFWSSSRLA